MYTYVYICILYILYTYVYIHPHMYIYYIHMYIYIYTIYICVSGTRIVTCKPHLEADAAACFGTPKWSPGALGERLDPWYPETWGPKKIYII